MTTREDMQGWLNSFCKRVTPKKIYKWSDLQGKTVKKVSRTGDTTTYLFFETGEWAKIEVNQYSYDDGDTYHLDLDDSSIIPPHEVGILYKGEVIDQYEAQIASKYYNDIYLIDQDKKDREQYERLKARFERQDPD